MPNISWNEEKNKLLKKTRGVSFEQVRQKLKSKSILADIPHFNQAQYPNQRIFILKILDYVYAVPYVKSNEGIFLKTIYPNRKLNKRYIGGKNDNNQN